MLVDASIATHGPLFGQVLLSLGKITSEQLAQALEIQKQNHRYIGEILVELGFIGSEEIENALNVQQHFRMTKAATSSTTFPLSACSA
jgi:hypothetical protein